MSESVGSTPPGLPEAAICAAAVAKLRAEGWRVACEVSHFYRPIDAVGVKDGKVLVLEAKTGLTKKLKYQLRFGIYGADYALAVVRSKPRQEGLEWCRQARVGLWVVRDGVIEELVAPVAHAEVDAYNRERLINAAMETDEQVAGGLPCLAGVGEAQDVQRRVDEYRAAHPDATWKEIHANVPSHYRTAGNMYSALRSNRERLAFRARMKAARVAKQISQTDIPRSPATPPATVSGSSRPSATPPLATTPASPISPRGTTDYGKCGRFPSP